MVNSTMLEITRPNMYVAMLVSHEIYIDDHKVGEVGNGKTETFQVSLGEHTIQVKQGLMTRSNLLSLDCLPNQTIRLRVMQKSPLSQLFKRTKTKLNLERLT